ncbi:MAG: NAD(P)-dependent oxidoreductase [Bacteroidaceae bacterium]|nr:NAD(P)-dependent oxidoreductase [Bacteroidaceae bacterium]
MANVLLIGATGFVGTALLNELLSRGHQVTAIVRNAARLAVTHERLTIVEGDATDVATLAAVDNVDAVISSFNAGWSNPNLYEDIKAAYPRIVEGVKQSGAKRLLVVGGAGILYVQPGVRLVDSGLLPAEWMPGVRAMAEFYLNTLSNETQLDWTYLAPAGNLGNLQPGTRTGQYRVGSDSLLTDANGDSFISVEDYAVAMVDELESPKHSRQLFTVAY